MNIKNQDNYSVPEIRWQSWNIKL